MKRNTDTDSDPEITAISEVYSALKTLKPDAQERVLTYVARKLSLKTLETAGGKDHQAERESAGDGTRTVEQGDVQKEVTKDDEDGISPVAKKWMTRNGLNASGLSSIFSLGVDEIDLIAKVVPGKNKKDKMRSVFLLKGVAAYLGGGAARFSHQQVKETCLHYDAFDAANFAINFKSLTSEVSGTKDSGYSLTARGLASATDLVKEMVGGKSG